ncbi:MAG: Nif3-like dinuclear metal center hexameric protein [Cytophagales bacterium]|nr:Nif3-like dinuclear metal center hexameric protein [Cytophagales bacterium]
MKVKDILTSLEAWAPPSYQESYDNSGLLIGDSSATFTKALITLDVTEAVLDEAIEKGCNLVIAHHPLIFGGIKRITGHHWVERCIIKAIKNDLIIYAIHTNLDNVHDGVNAMIARKIGLQNVSILKPKSDTLTKLVTFVPVAQTQGVLDALYQAGLGEIGKYDHCSFRMMGTGTFRPDDTANPAIGTPGKDEEVEENRIEGIFPSHAKGKIVAALKQNHPYEEVVYDMYALENSNQNIGSGAIGTLESPMESEAFIVTLKERMELNTVKCTAFVKKHISKVAICGGSGGFLLRNAKRQKADIFITSDYKYHEFFEADEQIIIADIGHYESEVFTKNLIAERLQSEFADEDFLLSEVVTNPVKYF